MPGDQPETGDEETPEVDAAAPEESTVEGIESEESTVDAAETEESGSDGFAVTRRKAVVGGLGLAVGGGVGVGATLATKDSNQIRKQQPNSDGKGTLGELRWVLEEKHGLTVTSMVRAEDTVRVEYDSAATSSTESRLEIGSVISAYGLIVANDGPTTKLSADVGRAFDDQATSYFVQAEWVQKWRSGDLSDAGVAQRVFNTRKFPKSASPESASSE